MASYSVTLPTILLLMVKLTFVYAASLTTDCTASNVLEVKYDQCVNASLQCGQVVPYSTCLTTPPALRLPDYNSSEGGQFFLLMVREADTEDDCHVHWVKQNISGSNLDSHSDAAVSSGKNILSFEAPRNVQGEEYLYHTFIYMQHQEISEGIASNFQRVTRADNLMGLIQNLMGLSTLGPLAGQFQFGILSVPIVLEITTGIPEVSTSLEGREGNATQGIEEWPIDEQSSDEKNSLGIPQWLTVLLIYVFVAEILLAVIMLLIRRQLTLKAEQEDAEFNSRKPQYTVILMEIDQTKKIPLIKEIRNRVDGMNLVKSKKLVESLPQVVKKKLKKEEAEELKKRLEALGCSVVVEGVIYRRV